MSSRSPQFDTKQAHLYTELLGAADTHHFGWAVKPLAGGWYEKPLAPISGIIAEVSSIDLSNNSVFICPAPRNPSSTSRRGFDARSSSVVWVDYDAQKADRPFPRKLFSTVLRPYLTIVESGSPKNFHGYIRLSKRVNCANLRLLNFAFAQVLGGDDKWADESLLRLPGTFNPKAEARRPVRITQHGTDRISATDLLKTLLDHTAQSEHSRHVTKDFCVWATREKTSGRTLTQVDADIPFLLARVKPHLASCIRRNQSPTGGLGDESQQLYNFLRDLYKGSDLDEDEAYTLLQTYDAFMERLGHRAALEVSKVWFEGETTPARKAERDKFVMGKDESKAKDVDSQDEDLENEVWSDRDNAKLLFERHGSEYAYNSNSKTLYRWDGTTFTAEEADRSLLMHTEEILDTYPIPEKKGGGIDGKAYSALHSQRTINAAISLFCRRIAQPGAKFDHHAHLLNMGTMVYDCATGRKLKPKPEYLMTRRLGVNYDPTATCPRFEKFMAEILPNEAERKFVIRCFSQALNGAVTEKIIPGFVGPKDTGKTVLLQIMTKLFGSYGTPVADEVMFKLNSHKHEVGLHQLKAARFGYYVEPPVGAKFNDGLMKRLSGGDPMQSRAMFGSFEQWDSQVTLFLACNSLPKAPDDAALRGRFRFVEFNQVFEEDRQDRHLERKLLEELPGILNLLLADYQEYLNEGVVTPDSVRAFNKQLTDDQNPVREALDNLVADGELLLEVADDPDHRVTLNELYVRYETWHKRYKGPKGLLTKILFNKQMRQLGYTDRKSSGMQYWTELRFDVTEII